MNTPLHWYNSTITLWTYNESIKHGSNILRYVWHGVKLQPPAPHTHTHAYTRTHTHTPYQLYTHTKTKKHHRYKYHAASVCKYRYCGYCACGRPSAPESARRCFRPLATTSCSTWQHRRWCVCVCLCVYVWKIGAAIVIVQTMFCIKG